MRTCLASFRHRPGFVAACFLCSLFAAPLLTVGAARAQEGFAGWPAGGDGSFPSSAQKPVDPPQSAPRWTFSAETIVLGRTGGANQPLVGLLPGGTQFADYAERLRLGRRSVQQQPVLARLLRRTENKRDLSRRLRLRRGVLVFQHLHPERNKDGRPHRPHQSGGLAGHVRPRRVLADPGFPIPRHGLERRHEPLQRRGQRAAGPFPSRDRAGRIAVAPTQRHACRLADSG